MEAKRIDENFPEIKILQHEALSNYTYTKTGGPGDWVAFPKTVNETERIVQYANEQHLPITIIGNASNLIVRDGGIRGLVIILTSMDSLTINGSMVTAEAGATIIDVTKAALAHSLSGLEFAAGIPGSVGGAVFMNAGAYDGEVREAVQSVKVLTMAGKIQTFTNAELKFSYRHSVLQDNQAIVLSATFELHAGQPSDIKATMDDLNQRRAEKQPLELPSCGSVFQRPKGHFAGPLIQNAGLQGFTIGGAQVSKKHAGFIVNIGDATATDYLNVIKHVQATVLDREGVVLETEVRIIGDAVDSLE